MVHHLLLAGLLGIGGGLIAIPILAVVYGMDQHLAQGTALVMIIPNVVVGFLRYRQRKHIDLRATARLALSAGLGSYAAARYAAMIAPATLRIAFGLPAGTVRVCGLAAAVRPR